MSAQKNNVQPIIEDIHTFLEKTLIDAFLKGKGYTFEDLKNLPEVEAKQLMKEASTYASGKLAEVEVKAPSCKNCMTRISADEVLRGFDPCCVCFVTSPLSMHPQPATDHLTWFERSHALSARLLDGHPQPGFA